MKAEGVIEWKGNRYAVLPPGSSILGFDLGRIALAGTHLGCLTDGWFCGWAIYKPSSRRDDLMIATTLPNTQHLTGRRLLELP